MNQTEDYVKAHDMQRADLLYLIDEFGDDIAKMHGKCIDIGCGPGSGSRPLLSKLPPDSTVVGVDVSKTMIEYARMKQADEERLSFAELDITAEKLPSQFIGVFNNAVSVYCIHWCSDPRQVFKNIYKLLQPGGRGLVLFVASHSLYTTYPKLHDNLEYQPYMKDYSNFIPYLQNQENRRAAARKIIEESGFDVLHCSDRIRTFTFKNWDVVKKHAVAVNPFMKRMPKELQKKYAEDLLREVCKAERAKIIESELDNEATRQQPLMSIYHLLIAHFRKPPVSTAG